MKITCQLPSAERLHEVLVYNADTGALVWAKYSRRVQAGSTAGHCDRLSGYIVVWVDGKNYRAHRIAWKLHYGVDPVGEMDHVNGNRSDNRIANLRCCSPAENLWNSKTRRDSSTGYKGVTYQKRSGKFVARIATNKTQKYLGLFEEASMAHEAYRNASKVLHGTFSRT